MWWLQNIPGISLFLQNAKEYNHSSYISFKIVSLWKYELLPAAVKMLETFLGAI